MLPVLLALSYWQFAIRRPWKHDLVARLEAARTLPPLKLAEVSAARDPAALQYRRAALECRPGRVAPYDVKGGTSAADDGGFLILVACAAHPDVVAVAGWTLRPDTVPMITVDTRFTGTLIVRPYGSTPGRPRFMLIPTTAAPGSSRRPLAAGTPPLAEIDAVDHRQRDPEGEPLEGVA